jgi:putative addiction module component (TIGR02574 family)
MMSSPQLSVFDLSPSEKLQLVEDLWDDLASSPDEIPVQEWQKEELDRRKKKFNDNPSSGLTWEAVKKNIRGHYNR